MAGQLQSLQMELERERKHRVELTGRVGELSQLSHDQEDEVASLMIKLSEANEETQRTKRQFNQVMVGSKVNLSFDNICVATFLH